MSRLREIHLRRYNLRRSAVEFFLTDHSSYLINFPSTKVIASFILSYLNDASYIEI